MENDPNKLEEIGDSMCYPRDKYKVQTLFELDPFIALTWVHRVKPTLLGRYSVDQMMKAPHGPLQWYLNKLAVVVMVNKYLKEMTYCVYAHDGKFYMITCYADREVNK